MHRLNGTLAAAAIAVTASLPAYADQGLTGPKTARTTYLSAINSNDTDLVLAAITHDAVIIAPGMPPIEGKFEVALWADRYFDQVSARRDDAIIELHEMGGWAFERYNYTITETPRDGGSPTTRSGQGMTIYRTDRDGVWRVAHDISIAFNTPDDRQWPSCTGAASPC